MVNERVEVPLTFVGFLEEVMNENLQRIHPSLWVDTPNIYMLFANVHPYSLRDIYHPVVEARTGEKDSAVLIPTRDEIKEAAKRLAEDWGVPFSRMGKILGRAFSILEASA